MVSSLELTNFRSYAAQGFDLQPGVTLVVGPNASGKTNLLESLYVLATTKSFRAKDADLVRHQEKFYRIVADVDGVKLQVGFEQKLGGTAKSVKHDSVARSISRHVGTVTAALFEPGDLGILTGPPEPRRRYLDGILCQTSSSYLESWRRYKRILLQRNHLLDQAAGPINLDELFTWDVQLAEQAGKLVSARYGLIEHMNGRLSELYAQISGEHIELVIDYLSTVPGEDYTDAMLARLTTNLARDLGAGFTTIGPHREDFGVRFKDGSMSAIASRGELRTAILAMKLVELGFLEHTAKTKPLLLLDDVFSELDQRRRAFLVERLGDYQTIITTTEADSISGSLKRDYATIETKEFVKYV